MKRTGVYDLVHESLKETALSRPADPLKFVASFLQERAHLYDSKEEVSVNASAVTKKDLEVTEKVAEALSSGLIIPSAEDLELLRT